MAEGQSPEEEGVGHQNQHQLHQTRELQQLKQPNLQQVITVQHYQAPAPSNVIATVNPDSASSTTKEEEWVTKKKVELTTKRQIETRVKRQVVLEDGRVVEDSGPIVTTNTTEDTEKQESSTTEKRDLAGDGEGDKNGINRDKELEWSAPGTVATQEGLLREVKEKKVCSRQETSELLETEDVQHLGDITDQDYQKAVQGRDNDLRATLERCRRDTDATRRDRERQLQLHRWDAARNAAPGRVVHRSTKSRKVVDSEDSQRLHALGPDGKLITETRTTTEHEEIEGEEQPDSGSGSSHCEEDHKESSTQFARTKQQQLVDYYLGHKRIGGEIKYESENFEGDRRGAPLEHQPVDWDKMSARARASRQLQQQLDRKDALTRRPLDPDQEERTRKHETDRWLDSHFGSVSSDDNDTAQVTRPAATSSFINVTMKSSKSPVPATPPPLPNDVTNSSHHVQSYLRTTSMSPVHRSHEQTTSSITPNRSNQTNERYSYSRSHLDRSNLSSPVERPVPTAAATTSATSESRTWYSTVQRNGHGLGHSGHNGRAVVSSEEEAASPSPPVRPRRRRGQDSDKEISRQLIEAERWRSQHSLANGYKTPDHVTAGDATLGDVPGGYTTPNSTPPLPYNGDYPHSPSPPPHHSTPYRGEGRGYSPSPTPDHIHQRASPQLIDDGAGNKKKIFQRTRFAAEIPLVKPKPQGGEPATSSKQGGLGLGRSLRKLVNKLGGGKSSKQETTSSTTVQSEPRLHHHHQTSVYQQPVQRYYLGEDPFSGSSIYGREREYHAAVPRRRHSNRIASDQGGSNQNGYRSTSTLGRLSRSTGRLASSSADKTSVNARSGGVHTLPRKLHNGVSWQQQQNYRNQETSSSSSRLNSDHRSGSLINVSIVNKSKPSTTSTTTTFTSTLGPAKPARTYRSSLLRSKSFSAQANDNNGISMSPSGGGGSGGGLQGLHHSSNPQLHRLLQSRGDDSPLKSPGIINSISRRDASRDASRNLLVRRLIDRVPQLYDALHGNGSASQFGNTANGSTTQFGNVTSGSTTQFGNTVNGITTQFGNTSNGSTTQFGNTANGTTTQFGSGALNGSQLGNGQSSVWTTSTTTIENRRYTAPVDRRGSLSSGGGVVIEVRNGD